MVDNKDLKENISEQKEKGIAMEILEELKRQNQGLRRIIVGLMFLVGFVVGSFLFYLYQYDFSGTIEQKGVYTLIDSDGNVIGSDDITPEQMEDILKIINGESEENQN